MELSNGCICCTLREDLLKEVQRLALSGRFDYMVIESSGGWSCRVDAQLVAWPAVGRVLMVVYLC